MRVCLDIQPAVAQRAGVGRYTRALAEHLAAFRGADSLRLFYFDFQRKGQPPAIPDAEIRALRWCPGRLIRKAWTTLGWPPFDWFSGKADLFHFPNFVIPPLGAGKAVVTIHDVSFLRFPEFAETKNLAFLNAHIRKTVARADAIITDSAFSAREITALLGVEPSRIFAIHPGVSGRMAAPPPETAARLRRSVPLNRPYLLTVGTVEPRKNLPFLVELFEQMTSFDGQLVIAGMRGWKFEPILERFQRSPRARDILYLDYAPDELLPALYAGAELFLFPSLYEGFGFPPLEAMACGVPVLASGAESLREALGDAAFIQDGFDAKTWAGSAARLLSDTALRHTLADRGRRQAARFSWAETAKRTWDVYRKVAS